jgi:multidrug efflux system membrane fusion protein
MAQVGGILTHVAFKEGDEVQRGQVLFQIDPRPYQAALQQAEGVLGKDRAQLVTAQQDEKRFAQLVKQDYVTTQQYDQAVANAASLTATVSSDQAAVEQARLNLQYATIRAPIAGRAGSLLMKEGNLVKADGAPLVVINQIRPILVRFAVPSSNLTNIRKYNGNTLPITVQPVSGGPTSQGTLSFLDNAVDTTTGTILLKGRFDNTDATLWPGEFVNAALQLYVQQNALVAPAAAVVQSQTGTYVFVVKGGTATQREIKVQRTAGNDAIIATGVAAGDTVVTDGQLRLVTGLKVQIKAPPGTDQPRS